MADDQSYVCNLQRLLLVASQNLHALTGSLADEYENAIKRVAHANPETQTNINVHEGCCAPSKTAGFMDRFVRVRKPLANNAKRLRADRRASVAAQNAAVRRINRRLNAKMHLTHDSIVNLMKQWNVPVETFVAMRVNEIMRKYLTEKEKEFADTCAKTFFSDPPPFLLTNNVAVTWENDLKGLLTTTLDERGVVVKTPTDIFNAVMVYYTDIIDTAFRDLDYEVPGVPPNVAAINKVKTHNTFAMLVNNMSPNLRYNASSMLLTYVRMCTPPVSFHRLANTLSDIRFGTHDVEDAFLKSLVDPYLLRSEGETLERAVADPLNVISIRGYAYDQIKPALECEYALLKILFYLSFEFKGELATFVKNTYASKYEDADAVIAVNNVLQLGGRRPSS
ncbi:hypothetical protein ElyMa_003967100 [Elysia marginata]|uniref:Uncharacterized protein n=1 Tax=Elysia marginata TaxID=1093978 RepID=A0AAV4FW71_9GAST|nr:hypothetical protein ElyMa_003967100 [Elysia marginata]